MPRFAQWLLLGVFAVSCWGCGGDDSGKNQQAGGANAGGGAAGGGGGPPAGGPPAGMGAPGMGAGMPGMGGMGPPGGMMPGAGGSGSSSDQASTSDPQELLQYIPESLKLASGANFGVLSAPNHPVGAKLIAQFQPITSMLARGGIKSEQIDYLWSGTNRDSGDMVICVRTKASYDSAALNKGLGAAGESEKIGKASVFTLSTSPVYKNALAFIDGKTFLVGRYDTVVAALKNPAAGAVRYGFESIGRPDAYYWLAGEDTSVSVPSQAKGLGALKSLAFNGPKVRGWGAGLGGQAAAGGGGAPGGSMASMASYPGGGPPPGMGPPAGMGPPPGMGPPGSGYPGMPGSTPGGTAASPANVDLTIGMSFPTEALAQSIEQKINDALKLLQQAAAGGGLPGMGPGGGPPLGPPGSGPAAPVGPPGLNRPPGQFQQQPPAGPPGSPQGYPPGMMPPGMMPGSRSMPAADGALSLPTITRDKQNLRFTVSLPATAALGVVNNAIQAMGASAVADGLFEGTLALLAAGEQQWHAAATAEALRGVRRVGELPVQAGYSWMTGLLPYVGFADLHSSLDFEKSWTDLANRQQAMTVIPAFLNPADPRSQWEEQYSARNGMGLAHFAGMSGIEDGRNVVAAELPRSDPRAGIFGYDEIAKLSDITDGTSQTIMIVGTGEASAPWIQGGGATIRGARAPYFDKYTGLGSRGLQKPGTYVLMADGSARIISADIDPEVFKAMCTMHGAEQVDMSKFVTQGND